jgi:MFS family permease
VVLLLVGGVIADRFSHRLVMLSSDLLRTLTEIGLGVRIFLALPPLWGFVVLAAVDVGSAFFNPALTGLVPQSVSEGKLLQTNALNSLSVSVANIIGPAIAGVIIAVSSPAWAVLIDGLT